MTDDNTAEADRMRELLEKIDPLELNVPVTFTVGEWSAILGAIDYTFLSDPSLTDDEVACLHDLSRTLMVKTAEGLHRIRTEYLNTGVLPELEVTVKA